MQVELRPGEVFEQLLRRFKRSLWGDGILREVANRQKFMKPSEKRKFKRARALTRLKKKEKAKALFERGER